MNNSKEEYTKWINKNLTDKELNEQLLNMSDEEINEAFYKNLEFGTGGLRGVLGAGTNRMNIYTVAKASQGLANYLLSKYGDKASVAIGYDSRIKSDVFAEVTAGVFAANGVKVYIWPKLLPVSTISYAVRYLHTSAGVMITASHNPSKYNGYKVYGADGCQITTTAASEIIEEIDKLDIFEDVKKTTFDNGMRGGNISYINEEVLTAFINEIKNQSMLLHEDYLIDKNVAIIYSPLNGTGLIPVIRTLKETGYTNITVVKEQEKPDGNFPTCPYPNPEIKEAMSLGIEYAKKCNADLLLATDPDCDRVGIAVKDYKGIRGPKGEYVLLSGNETGILLLDYICNRRIAAGTMPTNPVMVKTIVTSDMARQVANNYGVRTIDCLTGFKFIGEQIGRMESNGEEDNYIFGMEESYGYLTGGYVRDKDAVGGSFMICEMFAYYTSKGVGLLEKLEELYNKYGYRLNTLHSYEFNGVTGSEKMKKIMEDFRGGIKTLGGQSVEKTLDYLSGINGLPEANVLKFLLCDEGSVVVRPSGTEPKIKFYISLTADSMSEARMLEEKVINELEKMINVM